MKYNIEDGPYADVWLDGELVLYVQQFDDEEGVVTAPLISADGRPIFDHGREDYALVHRNGVVTYKLEATRTYAEMQSELEKARALSFSDNPFLVDKALPGELSDTWNVGPMRSDSQGGD